MKRIRSTILVLFFIATAMPAAFPDDPEGTIRVDEVMPGMFVVVHAYPWPSNSLLAVMENGEILLVDTPYTPKATESLLHWAETKFGKRTIKAINTHFHVDRLGGNEALVKRNISIYASDLTAPAIKARGKASLDTMVSWVTDESIKEYYRNFKYVPPTRPFDSKKGLTLIFGNEKAYVKFLGAGHSMDNCIVYFPKRKLIFGGCLIYSTETKKTGNVNDGDINAWEKTLGLIDTKGYTTVIPGHGKIGGIELIQHTKDILSK